MDCVTRSPEPDRNESLDDLFEVLADQCRRTVVAELSREGPTDVASLAEKIAADSETLSETDAQIALVHNHLPRLADAGVVHFDRSDERCELAETETGMSVGRVLNAARTHL